MEIVSSNGGQVSQTRDSSPDSPTSSSRANSSQAGTTTATLVTVSGLPIKMDMTSELDAVSGDTGDVGGPAELSQSTVTLETAPHKLQKIVLEDISAEEYYKEHTEETTCKIFRFQITNDELKNMIENSILDTSTSKPYRYLTGNFIRVFEKHVEAFEKMKVPIQKRNNIVYEESARNNTVYLRINGDCKLCPKSNRVKYVFTVKNKPAEHDKYVEVETKCRGVHNHQHAGNMVNNSMNGGISNSIGGHRSRLSLPAVSLNSNGSTSSSSSSGGQQERVVVLTKKRKLMHDDSDYGNGSMMNSSTSPNMSINSANTSTAGGAASSSPPMSSRLNASDKTALSQIVNQISNKVMIKLDQINLKLNQISDRLFDLERKFETIEVAEII